MTGSLTVDGLEQLRGSLTDASRELVQLEDAAEAAGDLLEQRATADAPRLSGHLAGQHEHTVTAGQVTVINTARYAKPVHARQPWLTSALDALTRQVVDIYSQHVDQTVDDIRGA